MDIRLKRVYEPTSPDDGFRVLIDRLWPRGVAKERAHIDLWAKQVAPSAELRRLWHADVDGHSAAGFARFTAAYDAELEEPPATAALDELINAARTHSRLTLVYAAKDEAVNHAVVLREALLKRAREQPRCSS